MMLPIDEHGNTADIAGLTGLRWIKLRSVTAEELLVVFNRKPLRGLPADAEIVGVKIHGSTVTVKVHSESFDAVPAGQVIPTLQ